MGIRVGIDLGSCYSSLAYVNPTTEELVLIPNIEGELKTPSMVVALGDNTLLFGQEALDKRLAGEGEIENLSADYLKYLIEVGRQRVGQEITEAVITVPSFYTDGERRNLKDMLNETGVKVSGILNETTAVALAYSYRHPDSKAKVLIYKLGGGSFEAAVADIDQTKVRILGSTGSRDIGGREWEDVIASYIQDCFYREFGVDYTEDKLTSIRVRALAEQIKIRLSQVSGAEAVVHYKGYTGNYYITREMFCQMTKTLLELTTDMVKKLLSSLSIEESKLNGILFSGGSTKMPMIREHLERELNSKSIMGVNTDYDVAYGAAIKAWLCQSKSSNENVVYECVSNSIGMIAVSLDGSWYVNSIFIRKNDNIPVSNTRTFRLSVTKTFGKMSIYLLQGEATIPKDCTVIGKYVINQIPYVEGGKSLIEITYTHDADGIIHIEAKQTETGENLVIHKDTIPLDMDWVNRQPKLKEEEIATEEEGLVYLCMDLSGSMAGLPFMEAKRSLRHIAEELDLTRKRVGIIGFSDQSQLLLSLSSNINNITRTIQRLHISGRMFGYGNGTSLFAMIYDKHCLGEMRVKEDVTMVVATDGAWPDKERALQVANLCKEKGITIYTMAYGKADNEYLMKLSSLKEVRELTRNNKNKGEWLSIAQIVGEDKAE